MVTPARCHKQIAPYGRLVLKGIPVQDLVDTGASVSCLAHLTWWQNQATWGALRSYHQVIWVANGKPLPIVAHTEPLQVEWEPITGRTSSVVISRLAGTPTLIRMALMILLHLQIDATR